LVLQVRLEQELASQVLVSVVEEVEVACTLGNIARTAILVSHHYFDHHMLQRKNRNIMLESRLRTTQNQKTTSPPCYTGMVSTQACQQVDIRYLDLHLLKPSTFDRWHTNRLPPTWFPTAAS